MQFVTKVQKTEPLDTVEEVFYENLNYIVYLFLTSYFFKSSNSGIKNKLILRIPSPNLFLINSVKVKPLGNSFLILGPKLNKNNIGAAVPNEYPITAPI